MEEHDQSFDVCIFCAMYEEARAVLDEFSTRCNVSFTKAFSRRDHYEYRHTTIQNAHHEPLTVLVTWPSDRGPVQTGMDLKPFLDEFRPRFAAMAGICAGNRKKVKLGDLIVAECAYLYEEGKIIPGTDGETIQLIETKTVASTSQMLQYVRGFEEWKVPLREMKQARLKRTLKANEEPKRHIAPMASGMAVRSDNPFPWLRQRYHRNTLGVDMEAASFYRAFTAFSHIHSLVVKGVSDYGDSTKHDRYHDYAARASAVYLLHFIQQYVTEETMSRRDPPKRAGPSSVWNVPYLRNLHFTGREELLDLLDQHLSAGTHDDSTTTRRAALTQPQAIKGLGGIGKTQIAVEYAYRVREQFRYTHILWINAASEEALITSFVTLAGLLPAFPAKSETDQRKLVAAIKRWLEECKQRWLLIFDNADDVSLIQEYLPTIGNGSVLLTTRFSAVGSLASSIEVETMSFIEGTYLLLRRAQRFADASDEEINEAGNIVVALDHFPLALDQAGAYIDETQCSFSDYLQLYQDHRKALLARRGIQSTNYPDSVATTWSLSFQKVEHVNPAAADLLRLCAFLSPDRIPEELIKDGVVHWPSRLQQAAADPFTFHQMLEELLKFSLVKRSAEDHMLSIHRLVQAVQMEGMELDEQREWSERVVRAVHKAFPRDPKEEVASWPQCLRYLEQAQACDMLIQQHLLKLPEAADLLDRAGIYLREHALYTIAEPLFQRALHIREQQLGPDHLQVATPLYNLAILYKEQGKYAEAESLYQRALHIRGQQLGPDHLQVAPLLNGLANLYYAQGKYAQAEPLFQRALRIWEQQLGPDHPQVAPPLNNLAILYKEQGKYAQAEPLFQRALRIWEQQWGPDHPQVAYPLTNLASLYKEQGKYAEAEPLFQRALRTREQSLGLKHPQVVYPLLGLASLYKEQGRYAEAEPLYQRALHIREQQLGPDHPQVAISLNNLAIFYRKQGKYAEAESLFQRALQIWKQQLGPELPHVAYPLLGLANLYKEQGKYAEAEPLFQRALRVREQDLGPYHPQTAETLYDFAAFREAQNDLQDAASLYRRALAIREQTLGSQHPKTIDACERLDAVLVALSKAEEAALLKVAQSEDEPEMQ